MKSNTIELKNLIDCSLSEQLLVLSWRNFNGIRKWMNNIEIISESDHLKFISELKYINNKKFFLVLRDDKYLGVINFIYYNDKLEFGIYKNPYLKIKGIGSLFLEKIIEISKSIDNCKKIILKVKKNNMIAINLYLKYNFKIVKEDSVYYYMEKERGGENEK